MDLSGPAAGSRASGEVGEGDAAVLRRRGEAEVFGAEEEQRVEQHHGGVGAQLLALPQVGLQDAGGRGATLRLKEEAQRRWNEMANPFHETFFASHLRPI